MVLIKLLENGSVVSWREMERMRRELRDKTIDNERLQNEAHLLTSHVGRWALTALAMSHARVAFDRTFNAWRRETAVKMKIQTQLRIVCYMLEVVGGSKRRAFVAWVQAIRMSQRSRLQEQMRSEELTKKECLELRNELAEVSACHQKAVIEKQSRDQTNQ